MTDLIIRELESARAERDQLKALAAEATRMWEEAQDPAHCAAERPNHVTGRVTQHYAHDDDHSPCGGLECGKSDAP